MQTKNALSPMACGQIRSSQQNSMHIDQFPEMVNRHTTSASRAYAQQLGHSQHATIEKWYRSKEGSPISSTHFREHSKQFKYS